MPDEKMLKQLEDEIKNGEKELKRISKQLDALVELAISGPLEKDTIKSKEQSLLQIKSKTSEILEATRQTLRSMPDLNHIKQEAEQIRRQLLERFSGSERLEEMTFDEKKTLLHWIFDGKDKSGKPYGIYISKKGLRRSATIDYFLYGRITGLRTLKGADINHFPEDDGENEGGEGGINGEGGKSKNIYKTNSVTSI
ncbi:MAG: hypothetical protein HY881_16665 [Deltaproteobacteria bacterium]|nr:hypothetical protein [Deltaproteobacteria bacterium]